MKHALTVCILCAICIGQTVIISGIRRQRDQAIAGWEHSLRQTEELQRIASESQDACLEAQKVSQALEEQS